MKKKFEMDKKTFLELYESSKKCKVDLLCIPPETLKKMYTLLEEEVKILERRIEKLNSKIKKD